MYIASTDMKPNEEGAFAMTKATEEFVKMLARGALQTANGAQHLDYNHLAEFVEENDRLKHLHEVVPRKVRFSEIQHLFNSDQRR